MEFGWIGGPLVVLLIVLVNGFFVGSEMAMVASRRNRLEQLRADGNANAAPDPQGHVRWPTPTHDEAHGQRHGEHEAAVERDEDLELGPAQHC